MKVKKKDWEALNARLLELEGQMREAKQGILMETPTGPVLVNVVVPMVLEHLKVKSVHGYGWLLSEEDSAQIDRK
jgi:hypothetical protein